MWNQGDRLACRGDMHIVDQQLKPIGGLNHVDGDLRLGRLDIRSCQGRENVPFEDGVCLGTISRRSDRTVEGPNIETRSLNQANIPCADECCRRKHFAHARPTQLWHFGTSTLAAVPRDGVAVLSCGWLRDATHSARALRVSN